MPLPDTLITNPHQYEYAAPKPTPSKKWPRFSQAMFMTRLILAAGLGGYIAGSALITWAYWQGPFEEGTEEDGEFLEEIGEMMMEHPRMDKLLNDPEWEEWEVPPRMVSGESGKGQHFVTGALAGSKGIVQRIFFNRTYRYLNVIVSFGNGVEGWPDVAHGGVLSTMLKECMETLAPHVFPGLSTREVSKFAVHFTSKIIPGEVYSMWAVPASKLPLGDPSGQQPVASAFGVLPHEEGDAIVAYIERSEQHTGPDTISAHALAYGVFNVEHPLQVTEHGDVT